MDKLSDHVPAILGAVKETGELPEEVPENEPETTPESAREMLPPKLRSCSDLRKRTGLGPADLREAAAKEDVIDALQHLDLIMSADMSPEKMAAVASVVAAEGYTRGQIRLAIQDLSMDTKLADRFEHGYTITPSDFKRVIEEDESVTSAGKLYGYHEAMNYWNRMGEPGRFPDSLFEPVEIDGGTKYKLR